MTAVVTQPIVGQPASATVTFLSDPTNPGSVYDPPVVVLSTIGPFGTVTPYIYGTDSNVTRVSMGVYKVAFVPSRDGTWVVVGDAFDSGGAQLGAGISATLTVGPRGGGSLEQMQALTIVEQYIKPFSLSLVTNATVRLFALEDGVLTLPGLPVVSIESVTDVETEEPWLPTPTLIGNTLRGEAPNQPLIGYRWYDCVYSYGFTDATVPGIVATIVQRVASRLGSNPGGVVREAIGPGYSVEYGAAASACLLPDEMDSLRQFRPGRAGTLVTMDLTGDEVGPS